VSSLKQAVPESVLTWYKEMIGFDPVEPAIKERAYGKQMRNYLSEANNQVFVSDQE